MRRGLYPLCDLDALERVHLAPSTFVRAVLAADPKPALLQLRAKRWSVEQITALLVEIAPLLAEADVGLVVNDHPELALRFDALVHVGQGDPPTAALPPGVGHGRSTHSLDQLETALTDGPAYVALGPVFDTTSKDNPEATVGLETLRAAHVRTAALGVPLCAIGGIDAGRVALVAPFCELVAVIGAVVRADPSEVTRSLSALGLAYLEARS